MNPAARAACQQPNLQKRSGTQSRSLSREAGANSPEQQGVAAAHLFMAEQAPAPDVCPTVTGTFAGVSAPTTTETKRAVANVENSMMAASD